jgi:hypothetical protein
VHEFPEHFIATFAKRFVSGVILRKAEFCQWVSSNSKSFKNNNKKWKNSTILLHNVVDV